MLDRLGSVASEVAPKVDLISRLSIQALDSLPLPLLIVLFLACLALINMPSSNQSILPTHSPIPSEKDRLSPLSTYPSLSPRTAPSQFDTGIFGNSPQYVAVVATGRRSSRYREWRGSSLGSVEEVDEKREELC